MEHFKKYRSFIQSKFDSSLADRIRDVYLENLDSMSDMKQQHFLSRLSKCYPNKWKSKIEELGKKMANQVTELSIKYREGNFEGSIDSFLEARNSNNAHLEAKKKGNKWIEKNKIKAERFLSYLDLLMKFNIVHRLRCENRINDIESTKNKLIEDWDSQVNWVINNPESFILIPVQSINVFYYMQSLKIMDPNLIDQKEEIFLDALRNSYKDKLDDEITFNNYLYALTHVIIGKSWFYEYKMPDYRQKYRWIIDFFKNYQERIIAESTPDIIIEIGVVMLICNKIREAENYKKYTRSRISPKGYIEPLNKTKGLGESEHTNILAIMLLKGF